jgi:hypothetical protein
MNADTFHEDVRAALRTQLFDTEDLPASHALEGCDFTPALGVPWVRESYKPGPEDAKSLHSGGQLVRMEGLYMVDLFYPNTAREQGTLPATRMADKVRRSFRPGASFTYNGQRVTVVKSFLSSGDKRDGWYMVPVTVKFRADYLNT